jgi:hypothetical protein
MFFQYPVSTQQMIPVCSIFLYRVFCDFWIDRKFDIFGFRSMPLYSSLHDTVLINGFAGVPCIHRQSSHLHPPPNHQRVAHTRLGEFLSFWHAVAPLTSPAFLHQDFRWIQSASSFSADERPPLGGAWFSHTVSNGSHSTFLNCFCLSIVYVFCLCLFLGSAYFHS